ncbi:hypothetical protein HCU64_14240 [Methylobacterium sp. C25]|uniref:hypothetical protein n=1 Tax=Methylobacterium sp. C25 TaxID=2721622 RepID=UPI001F2AC770|nr:hypothetical protein [Methylobacterium sp. C25]MCE4224919.1 hypothetical protein [Methylobacterium sp. C25]
MSNGIPLLILALGTLGAGLFIAGKARKDVADLKGDPARSNLVKDHGGEPRQNMPATEH